MYVRKWEETESACRARRVVRAESGEAVESTGRNRRGYVRKAEKRSKAQVGIDGQYMRKAEKRSKAHVEIGGVYMRKTWRERRHM